MLAVSLGEVRSGRRLRRVALPPQMRMSYPAPDQALACAVVILRRLVEHRRTAGFAPKVRIGVHASGATQVGKSPSKS